MSWSDNYKQICDYLDSNGLEEKANYLREVLKIGATGGEIFDMAISRLNELKNSGILSPVSEDVKSILEYAKSINH